jgi:anti-sigma regulatory factor (Ser/Thr protein kinase)
MNAMEHGNQYRPDLPVEIEIFLATISPAQRNLVVCIRDHGGHHGEKDISQPEVPDLDAKLAGLQTPRGWGLFLIKNMVDEMRITADETHHVVELVLHLGSEA